MAVIPKNSEISSSNSVSAGLGTDQHVETPQEPMEVELKNHFQNNKQIWNSFITVPTDLCNQVGSSCVIYFLETLKSNSLTFLYSISKPQPSDRNLHPSIHLNHQILEFLSSSNWVLVQITQHHQTWKGEKKEFSELLNWFHEILVLGNSFPNRKDVVPFSLPELRRKKQKTASWSEFQPYLYGIWKFIHPSITQMQPHDTIIFTWARGPSFL